MERRDFLASIAPLMAHKMLFPARFPAPPGVEPPDDVSDRVTVVIFDADDDEIELARGSLPVDEANGYFNLMYRCCGDDTVHVTMRNPALTLKAKRMFARSIFEERA